jgi:uncharacterized protein
MAVRIDFHMHLYPTASAGRQATSGYDVWEYGPSSDVVYERAAGTLADGVAALAAADATHAVVANLVDPLPEASDPESLKRLNRWLCEATRKTPEFIPFVGVDLGRWSAREAAAHLIELVEAYGVRGLKIHPVLQGFQVGDGAFRPFFSLCAELGVIVLSHSGPGRDRFQAGPSSFRPLLEAVPDLQLVVAHLGGREWREAAQLAADYPQVRFDCSEIIHWTSAANAPTPGELVDVIRAIGTDRVLAGSDFPWYSPRRTFELVDKLGGLSRREKADIAGENARRLLGLPS